ncbi:MAG: hypothetical protein QM737_01285 [Ferruginibacter sp.]
MKAQSQTQFNQVNKTTTDSLNIETGVKGTKNGSHKTFSSADLWNIQRQRKSIVIR